MHNLFNKTGLKALRLIDPEDAHNFAIWALKKKLVRPPKDVSTVDPSLSQVLWKQTFTSPVGVAAGFDKNAHAYRELANFGFGFVEIGAITPLPQNGNPRPRVFRLTDDYGVINRFGFNNDGMDIIIRRLAKNKSVAKPVWANIGANKDSSDRIDDYRQVLARVCQYVDGITLNVSSPNTQNLRNLQAADMLHMLVDACRSELTSHTGVDIPLLIKIAPDIDEGALAAIVEATRGKVDGIIATNTTIERSDLKSRYSCQTGGLSGRPLFEKSTQVLYNLYALTQGEIPLIGVGGVENAATAYTKIKAGASLVQLYTGLVYHGLEVCRDINHGLAQYLKKDGYDSITQAIGAAHR